MVLNRTVKLNSNREQEKTRNYKQWQADIHIIMLCVSCSHTWPYPWLEERRTAFNINENFWLLYNHTLLSQPKTSNTIVVHKKVILNLRERGKGKKGKGSTQECGLCYYAGMAIIHRGEWLWGKESFYKKIYSIVGHLRVITGNHRLNIGQL